LALSATPTTTAPPKVAFPVIADPNQMKLNRYLYGKVGPKAGASSDERAAWKRSILPTIIGMAQSTHPDEIRLLIEQCYPYVDASKLKRSKLAAHVVKPEGHDLGQDKPFGRIITPRPMKKEPQPVPAQIRPA
jgi:hypothetical protein